MLRIRHTTDSGNTPCITPAWSTVQGPHHASAIGIQTSCCPEISLNHQKNKYVGCTKSWECCFPSTDPEARVAQDRLQPGVDRAELVLENGHQIWLFTSKYYRRCRKNRESGTCMAMPYTGDSDGHWTTARKLFIKLTQNMAHSGQISNQNT